MPDELRALRPTPGNLNPGIRRPLSQQGDRPPQAPVAPMSEADRALQGLGVAHPGSRTTVLCSEYAFAVVTREGWQVFSSYESTRKPNRPLLKMESFGGLSEQQARLAIDAARCTLPITSSTPQGNDTSIITNAAKVTHGRMLRQ